MNNVDLFLSIFFYSKKNKNNIEAKLDIMCIEKALLTVHWIVYVFFLVIENIEL